MDDITAKVDKLICGIMDLAYEDPDHASEFIFGLISKLCIYSVFCHASYQMKKGMAKALGGIENKSISFDGPSKLDYDKLLIDIMQGKKKS